MSVRVRFAPSPTGKLHVGNARVALLNWLFARKAGGSFMLRLDDTDDERSTEEFAEAIQRDLHWLGLAWDVFDRQSARSARYDWAFQKLLSDGRLYPCYETPEELALKRKVQLAQHKPPLYDRAALKLTEAEKKAFEAQGIKPHWRFLLHHTNIEWTDLIKGNLTFHGANLSDPVLFRTDGRPIYTLASVVDDIDFAISHVLRGDDHITNTASQIQVTEALGGQAPQYGHLPLLTNAAGEGLSKRLGSLSLEHLRDNDGIEAMTINSALAKLGSSDAIEIRASLEARTAEFSLSKYSPSTARFEEHELPALNGRFIQQLSFADAQEKLVKLGFSGVDAAFWESVRPNLSRIGDIKIWYTIAREPLTPTIQDAELTSAAAGLLNDLNDYPAWIEAVKQKTSRKGKALFMPLRLALTGMEHGPELPVLLPLLGLERARARLRGEAA